MQVSILEGRDKQHDAQLQEQAAKTKEKAAELEQITKQLEVQWRFLLQLHLASRLLPLVFHAL